MTIGEKIQRCRKEGKMSQEDLAARLGVSRQAVSKWELNESIPDTENVIQLGRIFGVSLDYVLKPEITEDKPGDANHTVNNQAYMIDEEIKNNSEKRKVKKRFLYAGWIAYFSIMITIAILTISSNMAGVGFMLIINISVLIGLGYLIILIIKALRKYITK